MSSSIEIIWLEPLSAGTSTTGSAFHGRLLLSAGPLRRHGRFAGGPLSARRRRHPRTSWPWSLSSAPSCPLAVASPLRLAPCRSQTPWRQAPSWRSPSWRESASSLRAALGQVPSSRAPCRQASSCRPNRHQGRGLAAARVPEAFMAVELSASVLLAAALRTDAPFAAACFVARPAATCSPVALLRADGSTVGPTGARGAGAWRAGAFTPVAFAFCDTLGRLGATFSCGEPAVVAPLVTLRVDLLPAAGAGAFFPPADLRDAAGSGAAFLAGLVVSPSPGRARETSEARAGELLARRTSAATVSSSVDVRRPGPFRAGRARRRAFAGPAPSGRTPCARCASAPPGRYAGQDGRGLRGARSSASRPRAPPRRGMCSPRPRPRAARRGGGWQ